MTAPAREPVRLNGYGAVLEHDRQMFLMQTAADARRVIDLAGRALYLLEAQEREQQDQLDRDAAREMNRANAADHQAWGGSMSCPPVRTVHVIPIRACGSSHTEHCPDCIGSNR